MIGRVTASVVGHPITRVTFVLYALALTIGTHWPDLSVASPGIEFSDKILHAGAFFGGALLLGLTGWLGPPGLRSAGFAGVIGVAWAAADELTQGLPGLNRSVSVFDFLADLLGVAGAVLALVLIGLRHVSDPPPETF